MPGSWIPIEFSTPRKAEVLQIARRLGKSSDETLGILIRFWIWADQNSVDGRVDGMVDADVDAVVDVSGFSVALSAVGWLSYNADAKRIVIPHFSRINGKSAKKRLLTNRRQAKWRNAHVDAAPSQKASTKEKNIYKENNIKESGALHAADLVALGVGEQTAKDWLRVRKAPLTVSALNGVKREAAKAGLSLAEAVAMCAERTWRGFRASWYEKERGESPLFRREGVM